MTTTTRRSVVAMLGLAPATAVGAESFASAPQSGGLTSRRHLNGKSIAQALRNMADAVERGEIGTRRLTVNSDIGYEQEPMLHQMTLEFVYRA